jgi:hypothetical protein
VQQGQTGQGAGQSNRLLLLSLAALGVLVVALSALRVVVLRRKQGGERPPGMNQSRTERPVV